MLFKNSKNKVDQVQMISIDQMVPEDHILRKIDKYMYLSTEICTIL